MASTDDLYATLGVPLTAEADDIRKAFRTLALKLHPDKNVGKPDVAAKYERVAKAYEILGDVAARAAYDNVLAAKFKRQERTDQLDAKRRKLHDDLLERERKAATKRSEELEAQRELERQLYRLRTEGRRQAQEREVEEARREAAAEAEADAIATPVRAPDVTDVSDIDRTLRVKWPSKQRTLGGDALKALLVVYGEVEDVVSRKPGSALVAFKSIVGAHAAVVAAATAPELEGLDIGWAGGSEPAVIATFVKPVPTPLPTTPAPPSSASAPSAAPPSAPLPFYMMGLKSSNNLLSTMDYENITFMRLQQAAAAKRQAEATASPASSPSSSATQIDNPRDYENLAARSMRQAEERRRLREELVREMADDSQS